MNEKYYRRFLVVSTLTYIIAVVVVLFIVF